MARKGPPPKPTALKILAGNPGKRKLNVNEPRPPAGVPERPRSVSQDVIAKAEWDRIAPELLRLGLLTVLDGAALGAYCQTFSLWQQAEELLRRDGRTYKLPNGTVCKHPAVGITQQAKMMVRAFAAEFGMTPASRSRLHVTMPDDQESKKARRFFGD